MKVRMSSSMRRGSREGKRTIYKNVPLTLFFVAFLISTFFLSDALSDDDAKYKGQTYCKMCHAPKEAGWQQTRHAKAFDSLKKTNQHDLPDCVRCHVTGYEAAGGFVDHELTPAMGDVQCEACHGPGSKHVGEKKNIIASPGEDRCRVCHTSGQDPKFDYKKKAAEVHGPR